MVFLPSLQQKRVLATTTLGRSRKLDALKRLIARKRTIPHQKLEPSYTLRGQGLFSLKILAKRRAGKLPSKY